MDNNIPPIASAPTAEGVPSHITNEPTLLRLRLRLRLRPFPPTAEAIEDDMTNKTDTTTPRHADHAVVVVERRRGSRSSLVLPKTTGAAPHFLLLLPLLLLLLSSHLAAPVSGQDDTTAGLNTATTTPPSTVCSCSPREYTFRLDLSAACPALPPPFPPNDVFGSSGVRDYTCNVGPEPIPKSQFSTEEDVGGGGGGGRRRRRRRRRGLLRALREEEGGDGDDSAEINDLSDYFPELSADELGLEWSSQEFTTSQIDNDVDDNIDEASMTATMDMIPVVVYSIQFLEVDVDFNVINQDSAYVRNIDFVDGTIFNYTSIIAKEDGGGKVPGGVNLVLRGVNGAGDPVRNVFTITFTNDCGVPTFEVGEAIGWVIFEDFVPASEETCPTGGTAPTTPPPISPPTAPVAPPTPTPPTAPIAPPTPTPPTPPAVLPSRGPSSSMTYVAGWWEPHYDHAFSKSGKKSTKSGKANNKSGKQSTKSGKANNKSGKKNSTDGGGGGSDDANHHGHGWHGDGYGRRLRRE